MYTGIIQTLAKVEKIEDSKGLRRIALKVDSAFLGDVFVGASCALDGVCFTVVEIDGDILCFDAIKQTLDATTIGYLKAGDSVHFERSLRYGDENGGHNISGHVHATCKLVREIKTENNTQLFFKVPSPWIKYFFEKGFIALHGASLTISSVDMEMSEFSVSLIPETLRQTKFGALSDDEPLNFEVEQQTRTLVDVVERTLLRSKS